MRTSRFAVSACVFAAALVVNGSCVGAFDVRGETWTNSSVILKEDQLMPGENTFRLYRYDRTDYGKEDYDQIDYVQLHPLQLRSGLAVILR